LNESGTEKERLAAEMEREILGQLRQCLNNLMSLANGIKVAKERGDESPVVYDRPPDRAANEYILNRILGRPPSRKTIADPEPAQLKRIDLSKVPRERLETMERWLAEAYGESDRADTGEAD